MPSVFLTINDRRYQVACEDGQEAHLTRLGAYVDKRIKELVASVGQVGDSQLLVMASLLIADELSDAYAEVEALGSGSDVIKESGFDPDEAVGAAIEALAERVETVAAKLKQP